MIARSAGFRPTRCDHPKYPGADHAFARKGGKIYSKPEVDRALKLTVDFFHEHLG